VGSLVETPGFYPYLSGRENLRVLARYRALDDVAVEAALNQVDLTNRAHDRYRSYSLGMRQRLGVAAALLGRPDLLILDEPTNGLDPAGMADMRDLIKALAAEGQTIMLSSHLLGEVEQICDRVGVVAGGRLLVEGTVDQLRGAASLVVRVDSLAAAKPVAARVVGSANVSTVDGVLQIAAEPSRAPDLVRAMVAAGLDVHEVVAKDRSLEDVFFAVTSAATEREAVA
jgi:ABC-2 type transport system ATP-binding protein